MSANRYLQAVLTIIALELGWIALTQGTPAVSAQTQPTRVVITGIDLGPQGGYLPVGIVGAVRNPLPQVSVQMDPMGIRVQAGRPLQVEAQPPLNVRIATPVKVETDRPIKVENVGYTPSPRPGE